MPTLLKDLKIRDVSSVDRGAGEGVRVMLMKRDDQQGATMPEISQADVHEVLRKRASNARLPNETTEQAYCRMFVGRNATDELGKRMLEYSESIRFAKMSTRPLPDQAINRLSDDPPKVVVGNVTGKAFGIMMAKAKELMSKDGTIKNIGVALEKIRSAHPELRRAEAAEHGIVGDGL